MQSPEVTQAGTYTVSVMAENGCIAQAEAIVSSDSNLPIISAIAGTIDCNNEFAALIGSTTTENATIMWTGSNGFSSTDGQISVNVPGFYTFIIVSPGGCESFKELEIREDNKEPDISLFEGD